MRALVLDKTPRLIRDYPKPQRHAGEARIAVLLAGVCDTDLELARGYMGYRGVMGHEFVGMVTEADNTAWVGKRVVGDINAGCGVCVECRERDGHHCTRRSVLGIQGRDGALSDELVLPEHCLVEVPDGIPNDQAVFAEPLAAALHVLDDLEGRQRIAVLGDGKLGLLIALALKSSKITALAVGHHADKLDILARVGIPVALEADLLGQDASYDCVIDATGNPKGLARAFRLLAPRGLLILKTTVASFGEVDLSPVVIHELQIKGSRCGNLHAAIACLRDQKLDPSPLIAERYGLDDAEQALAAASQRGTLKVLVDPGSLTSTR